MKSENSKNGVRARINDLTIRTKLALRVGLLVAGIAIFVFWYFPSLQERQQMHALSGKTQSIADMTSFSIAPAIVFNDVDAMKGSFDAARQNKDLAYIVAVDENGGVLFAYNNVIADSAGYRERVSGNNISRDGNIYGAASSVYFQDREIGKVFIGLSLRSLKAEVAQSRATIALVSLGIFLVSIFSVLAIATVITVPLRRMSLAAQQIAQGNLSERAPVSSNDEVGMLARSFNQMVHNLSATQTELGELNRHLEQRVDDRTRELRQEIAERQRAQEAIRLSEERYRLLSESALTGVYLIQEQKFQYVNPTFASIFGFTVEEIIGKIGPMDLTAEEDRARVTENIRTRLVGERAQIRYGFRGMRKDGTRLDIEVHGGRTTYNGRPAIIGTLSDVSERTRAEEAIRRSEASLANAQRIAHVGSWDWNVVTNESQVSDETARIIGTIPGDPGASFEGFMSTVHPDDKEGMRQAVEGCLHGDAAVSKDFRIIRPDGSVRDLHGEGELTRDAAGRPMRLTGTVQDITERKQLEQQVQTAASQMKTLFDNLDEVFFSVDTVNNVTVQMSPACETIYGYPADAFFRNPSLWLECAVEGDRHAVDDMIREVLSGRPVRLEYRIVRSDGSTRWVEAKVKPTLDSQGNVIRLDGVVSDIAARRRAEENLRLAEEKYRTIFENAVVGLFQSTLEGRYLTVNPILARMYGFETPDELMAAYEDLNLHCYVKSGRRGEFITLIIQHGAVSGFESQVYRKDRSIIWISESARAMRDAAGVITGFEGTAVDITERKRAEESTSRLLSAVEQTDEIVFMTAIDGTITYVNPAFEELYGYGKDDAIGKTPRILKSGRYDNAYYERFWRELLMGRSYQGQHINRTKSGDDVSVEVAVSPVYNTENTLTGFISVQRDVTRRTREAEERRSLETQLAQAQKIESIGTLAGGIAHDFNNILGIILGHVSLLDRGAVEPERLASSLGSIKTAVERGAGVVKQILTFARKTEVLFEPVRLNETAAEVVTMLTGTFPKTITFSTALSGLDPVVEGDRTQLHQTLLNLCVNARDAMPYGGAITIVIEEETAADVRKVFPDARHERYARVSVTDTGSGMDRETVQRIFEPFFTTKEKGKGTGLGLAVVYGIVRGHGGFIDVKSELGRGTTFSLYLPLVRHTDEVKEIPDTKGGPVEGGDETILVVEDEEMLRWLLESVLTSHGYRVLTAVDGEKAVEMYMKHQHEIDLVVTDIGLPKMSGQDAFMKMKELNPEVKVILASGYLEPQAKADLFKAGAKHVVPKPYSPTEILAKIREVLR